MVVRCLCPWQVSKSDLQAVGTIRNSLMVTKKCLGAYDELKADKSVDDDYRIQYLKEHIFEMQKAIKDGVELISYCAWSFTYLLSWLNGYQKRYGFVYIDRDEQDEKEFQRKATIGIKR